MSAVWVQLYYEDKDEGKVEPHGRAVGIEPIPENVDAFVEATKKNELKKELHHAGLTEIFVYPPGTTPPFSPQDEALKGWDPIPNTSSGSQPLIMVAPHDIEHLPTQRVLINCRMWDAEENPTVLLWDDDESSPGELPEEITVHPYTGSAASSISSSPSTRGTEQRNFQISLLQRDKQKCIVSGEHYKPGANNVQATHIIPLKRGKENDFAMAKKAGLTNLNDTRNGMLLPTDLHNDFDAFLWCMDPHWTIHLSDAQCDEQKIQSLKWLDGHRIVPPSKDVPDEQTLDTRFQLFLDQVKLRKTEKRVIKNKKKKDKRKQKATAEACS